MKKSHNFYAGPSVLPEFTKEKIAEAVVNFAGTGFSVAEVSHRSKEFVAVMEEARSLTKELLDVPAGYSVLFLQGGASTQFLMVAYNLLKEKAAYLNTGAWSTKAIKEAKLFGEVVEVASSADKNFNYIPKNFDVPSDADYLHITTNNTIYGTEIFDAPEVKMGMVADCSSDIFSRPMDVAKYDLIYAGAQKNLGPSGATLVIVKEEALGKVERQIPTMLDYTTHIKKDSMFNTPATLPVFGALQTLKWIKDFGGLETMEKHNIEKAKIIYDEIERNKLFKCTIPDPKDRSRMNICFVMNEEYQELEKDFFEFASDRRMFGIKGHRSVGGFRASTYNALPIESAKEFAKTMQEFEKNN